MAQVTIVGCLADALGAASELELVAAHHPGRNFDVHRRYMSVPSLEYRSVQPANVVVDLNHDQPIGQLKYLERNEQRLHAVCEIDAAQLGDGPWFYSPAIRHYDGEDIELRGLAVTRSPASVGLGPLVAYAGTLHDAARQIVYQDGHTGALVRRADEYDTRRKHGQPLVIQGTHPKLAVAAAERAVTTPRIEFRSASAVDVNRGRRELDLVIAPAETPTTIHERGKQYTEVFSHGAFAGVEQNPERVKLNRAHERERIIGKGLRFDAWAEEGLTGTITLARVTEADEALELIDLDLLGVSVGFAVPSGGDEWRGTHRRVRRAELDHVALVAEPAYASARVVGVRSHLVGAR